MDTVRVAVQPLTLPSAAHDLIFPDFCHCLFICEVQNKAVTWQHRETQNEEKGSVLCTTLWTQQLRCCFGAAFTTQHPTCPALPACSHQQCSLSPCCLELHKEPFSLTLSQLQYAVLFSQKCRSAIVLLLGAQVGYQVNWTQVAAIYLQEAAPAPLPRAAYWHILSSSALSSSQS